MKIAGVLAVVASSFAHRHAAVHIKYAADESAHLQQRQDVITSPASATSLQAFETTYTYSYWSYTACTNATTTGISSSQVTTSTVLTVYASDSFHAFQSLLTAGQSVQDNATSSAAQALRSLQTPASVVASSTSTFTSTSTTTPQTSASTTSVTAGQTGGAWVNAGSQSGIALAIALAFLDV